MILQKMSGKEGGGLIIKIVLFGFLVMAVAGLVLTDVQGYFRNGGMNMDTVAKGGGVRITAREFSTSINRFVRMQGMSPEEAYKIGLVEQILNEEIRTRLLAEDARDMGLVISDDMVRGEILKLAEPLAQGGMSKTQALQQVLAMQGISETEFISDVKNQMAIGLLREALVSGTQAVADDMARAVWLAEREKRDVQVIAFTSDSVTDIQAPDEDRLKIYYDANKMDYATPETRTITLTLIDKKTVQPEEITEEELRAAYDQNSAAYQKQGRMIKQAVFKERDAAQAAFEAVQDGRTIEEAGGESFKGERTVMQDDTLIEVAGPVMQSGDGDVVGPILSPQGWHVIVVGESASETTTPFEEVKAALKKELNAMRAGDALYNTAQEIDDQLASGEPLEDVVARYDLKTQKIGPFRQTGFNGAKKNLFESFGTDSGQMIDAAFTYEQGEVSPVIELDDGRFAIVRVDEATDIVYAPFEEVENDLKKRWDAEQRALMNRARAQEALAKAQEGAAFNDIAKAEKLSVKNYTDVTRGKEIITPIAHSRIFSSQKDDSFLAESDEGFMLVKIIDTTLPINAKPTESDLDAIKKQIAEEQAQESLTQYLNARAAASDVRINKPLLDQIFAGSRG